ncbi:hypothetical protein GCM10011588_53640 [Nocardia jinanensis]|uniref:Uncharacterized protein n=1 Tax=Nocardia jinanensis TaxID=382504 RepID=A0A917RU96_9NOCA|nr:hypothetical protein GCM10011588_53640 [Nocardia jinanensis]
MAVVVGRYPDPGCRSAVVSTASARVRGEQSRTQPLGLTLFEAGDRRVGERFRSRGSHYAEPGGLTGYTRYFYSACRPGNYVYARLSEVR